MRALTLLSLLVVSLMIPACTTLTTATPDNDPALAAATTVLRICNEAWRPITYSSKSDSKQTVDEVKASNRARRAFCAD